MESWAKPFIGMAVSLLTNVLFWGMTIHCLFEFKKGKKENRYKAYYFSKKLLLISLILTALSTIIPSVGLSMAVFREKSFGLTLLWVFFGVSFALLVVGLVSSWLTYKYIFIGLEEEKIQFWGERVLCRKILELVKLEEVNRLVIFYKHGERNLRKEKLSLNTKAAAFLIENANLINLKVTDEISEEVKELMGVDADKEINTVKSDNNEQKNLASTNTNEKVSKTENDFKKQEIEKSEKTVKTEKDLEKPKIEKPEKTTKSEKVENEQEKNKNK